MTPAETHTATRPLYCSACQGHERLIKCVMRVKLVLGLFVALFGLTMVVANFGTTEEAVREVVAWGVISGIGFIIAICPAYGGVWGHEA